MQKGIKASQQSLVNLRKRAEKALRQKKKTSNSENPSEDISRLIHELEVHQIELEIQNEELRRTHAELEDSRSSYVDLYDFSPVGYFTLDIKGLIMKMNLACAAMLQRERASLQNKPFSVLVNEHDKEAFYRHCRDIVKTKLRQCIDLRLKVNEDSEMYFHLECLPVLDSEGSVYQIRVAAIDVTERRKSEEQIRMAAMTDELTGLLNRRGFLMLSDQQCKIADRKKTFISLIFLDLDEMKKINDSHGHKEGDRALRDTAQVIKKTFRESDIIGRIGGDEFAVLLIEPSKPDIKDIISRHINNNVKMFNARSSNNYDLSFSFGTASSDPANPCSLDDLFVRADSEMYKNKKRKIEREVIASLNSVREERRGVDRNAIQGDCRVEIQGYDHIQVKNISAGGICLANMDHLITSKFHSMNVLSDNKKIPVKGIMAWSKLTGEKDYELGLKFVGLTNRDRQSLLEVISASTQ